MTKKQKHLQSIKPVERTIWVATRITTDKVKDPKTGVITEVHTKHKVQGTMNLGRKKAKRELVANSLLKNPKKLNIKLRA